MEIKLIPPENHVGNQSEPPMGQVSPGACSCAAGCIPEFDPLNPNTVLDTVDMHKAGLKKLDVEVFVRIESADELRKVKTTAERQKERRARLKAAGIEQLNQNVPKLAHEPMTKIVDVLMKEVMAGASVEDALRKAVQPFATSAPAPAITSMQPAQISTPGQSAQGIQPVADTDTSLCKPETSALMAQLIVANEEMKQLAQMGEKVTKLTGWRRWVAHVIGMV